ncbi:MAG: hypothetical protein EOP09_00605 [Proteobacteria bacterium]|nr:MAG: hypothetical protein EOP09_00605 [Pseudomonadota bacterium]
MTFKRTKFPLPLVLLGFLSIGLGSGCGKDADKRAGGIVGATGETPVDPGGTGTASSLEFKPFPKEVYTAETADNSCVTFAVLSKANAAAVADVGIIFSVVSSSATTAEDKGKITPASGVTNAEGELEASYCSGKTEGKVTIVAKAGSVSINSGEISITKKPAYSFVYTGSDTPAAVSTDGSVINALNLNLIDSGPQDCTFLYFKLQRTGQPVVGAPVTFHTQTDFPKGVKLSRRAEPLATDLDPLNGKKMAKFEGVSSTTGEFAVPICTGSSLGSVSVSGSFTDPEEGRKLTAAAPVIRITSGTTSYVNFSLSFDPINARTLRAYYNTNSEYDLPFKVQTGARIDGLAIGDYPVTIATEVGRYTLVGGYPDVVTGEVPVKFHALHLVDNYPYQVTKFWRNQTAGTIYSAAQTRCDPNEIAQWVRATNAGTSIRYSTLKKNWQSTMVYAIRGQEYFNDANRNGVYDVGGNGFWDKNQNGVFDGNDVITYPVGATTFDPSGEWFIDMPTPFVDVDDDLLTQTTGYNPSIDMLLGDEYIAPNGKRDSDTVVWKSEVFPISMGASAFSLTNDLIRDNGSGGLRQVDEVVAANDPTTVQDDLRIFGLNPITLLELWDPGLEAERGLYNFEFFAQDLCGNLLPGGTKLVMDFETLYTPKYGDRKPTALLFGPQIDAFREPTRHLLNNVDGPNAEINFNSSDHPSASTGYPVFGRIAVEACSNPCTGHVLAAGFACDAWVGYARLAVGDPKLDQFQHTLRLRSLMTVPAVQSCTCSAATGVYFDAGECKCPEGTTLGTVMGTTACYAN